MKVSQQGFIVNDTVATPHTGQVSLYAKSDGNLYQKNDAGVETILPGGGGGTTAEALGTTGADVNVGASAPPVLGDILVATSATAATWQTPSPPPPSSVGPTFSAFKTSTQNISDTTFSQITFDSTDWNVDSCFNTSTGRFTPDVEGYYLLGALITTNSASFFTGESYISVSSNGSLPNGTKLALSYDSVDTLSGSLVVFLNGTTNFVQLNIFHSSGATRTISSSSTNFYGYLVRGV